MGYYQNLYFFSVLVLTVGVTETRGGDCSFRYWNYKFNGYRIGYLQCEQACCGYYYDRYCCTPTTALTGAVIGGLFSVTTIFAIIFCFLKSKIAKPRTTVDHGNSSSRENNISYVQSPPPYYSHFIVSNPIDSGRVVSPPPAYPGNISEVENGRRNSTTITTPSRITEPPPYVEQPPKY